MAETVPPGTPDEVRRQVARGPREPTVDPTVGIEVPHPPRRGTPPHRLVVLGDSVSHGFQSGAIYHTDISWPAIVARELGWAGYRYPDYGGPGGLPLNLELLLRRLEERFGSQPSIWETPLAGFAARAFMDEVEDYWERGPGSTAPLVDDYVHDLSVYGWDLRDVLSWTAASLEASIRRPRDSFLDQLVENANERAALRVYPRWSDDVRQQTLLDAAESLGADHGEDTDDGIETLVVFLGANNALPTVTDLTVSWSGPDFQDLAAKSRYTVWRPEHFAAELDLLVAAVDRIGARHVIWCTVPHVTIAPIARGIGRKVRPGSRYYPYYTRPWVHDDRFDPARDLHLTEEEARVVDAAIDLYNEAIEAVVRTARAGVGRPAAKDWYLLDVAGLLDRLATRRFITDPDARPPWWSPYPLPPALAALRPPPDSRFLSADGRGGRASGGLFSLDGVHPTTVGYGILAQEVMNVMSRAGVVFRDRAGAPRQAPVLVDVERLLRRDTLVLHPPQLVDAAMDVLGWVDEHLHWITRTLSWKS